MEVAEQRHIPGILVSYGLLAVIGLVVPSIRLFSVGCDRPSRPEYAETIAFTLTFVCRFMAHNC